MGSCTRGDFLTARCADGVIPAMITTQQCSKCLKAKPATAEFFTPDPRMKSGFGSWCRQCQRDRARATMSRRRADPVERVKVMEAKKRHITSLQGREWKRRDSQAYNHKRRQKPEHQWLWSPALWDKQVYLFESRCGYCGAQGKLETDHFIPLSHRDCPGTVPWNIVPACPRCSRRKGRRLPWNWCPDKHLIVRIAAKLEGLKTASCL